MPDKDVDGCKVAILATDGVEQVELLEPRKALDSAGAQTVVVSPKEDGNIRGWNHTDWGVQIPVDVALNQARSEEFDALLLPGGVQNPDKLRMNPAAVQFVREFFDAGKPVAAICHAAWTILEAGAADGRHMTSWPSLQTDLRNAGANWADEPVVRDRNLVTSRKPDDIPVFNAAMIELFREYMARTESEEQRPAA
ncbi:MAG: type 1 glutamine amidotransferase [Acidobacteriales bacterium]|nr:type 1 glutamine amidotransferase [Terriglobales bacterium]